MNDAFGSLRKYERKEDNRLEEKYQQALNFLHANTHFPLSFSLDHMKCLLSTEWWIESQLRCKSKKHKEVKASQENFNDWAEIHCYIKWGDLPLIMAEFAWCFQCSILRWVLVDLNSQGQFSCQLRFNLVMSSLKISIHQNLPLWPFFLVLLQVFF